MLKITGLQLLSKLQRRLWHWTTGHPRLAAIGWRLLEPFPTIRARIGARVSLNRRIQALEDAAQPPDEAPEAELSRWAAHVLRDLERATRTQ